LPYVSVDEALNATVVDPGESAVGSLLNGRRLPLVASEALRIVRWRLGPGEEPHRPHIHPVADEVMIVVDGLGMFTVGDDPEFAAGPWSLIYVPRGVIHRIRVPGPEPLVWLSIVAPNADAPDEAIEVEE
jgi:mannose-6-phosphate isomerase-like protein (cupin superfamily)